MINLYIVRHGIAVEPGTPGIDDDDRPLTEKGEKRMREIALGLRRLDLEIDRILTSPLPRAQATAKIIARVIGGESLLEVSEMLRPGTELATIQSMLSERTENNLMIVGHNPSLSQLVPLLVLNDSQSTLGDLKKGGIAALTAPTLPGGRYQLSWLATPRLFRRLGSGVEH